MSVMGMREWLRNNRTAMLVVFALLLLGLLITYGQFGQSGSYSEADYEAMIDTAREAYDADPKNPENVYTLAQMLGAYAEFLSHEKAEKDRIDAVDLEAVKYYDEYYALMAEQAKDNYYTEQTYGNAMTVASYLNSRVQAGGYLEDIDVVALSNEANDWMITAMELRYIDAEAALQADPANPALLADMAEVNSSLAHYKHEKDSAVDMNAAYTESLALVLQAVDNCTGETEPADKSGYYLKAAGYAQSLEDAALTEQYCRLAIEADPTSYNAQIALASFYAGEQRYQEGKDHLEAYLATLDKDDKNRAGVESSIEYLQMMIDAANSAEADAAEADEAGEAGADAGTEAETAEGAAQ